MVKLEWVVIVVVVMLYIHLFNAVANLYFDSLQTMTWKDLFHRFVPPVEITIKL
jgi:hypothetical protein